MSAGPSVSVIYEADAGTFHNLTQQPETAALEIDGNANTPPTGPVDSPFWFKTSRGATEYGGKPRMVTVRWTGTPPTGYKPGTRISLAVYDPAVFANINRNDTGTYLGAAIAVTGKTPEDIYPAI